MTSYHMIKKLQNALVLILSSLCLAMLAGCSVHTSKSADGKDKDVDIRSPFGSLSVHAGDIDTKDLGLPVYPGARSMKSHGDNDDNANVNINSPAVQVKVVALKYETDDPPQKVLDFYQKPMGKYGNVIQCNGSYHGGYHHHDKDAPVSCDNSGSNYEKELKVGSENNQHVVAVKPRGQGSEFTLVYVRVRENSDDKDTI